MGTVSFVTDIQAGNPRLLKESRVTEIAIAIQTTYGPLNKIGTKTSISNANLAPIPQSQASIFLRVVLSASNAPGRSRIAQATLEKALIKPIWASEAPSERMKRLMKLMEMLSLAEAKRPSNQNQRRFCWVCGLRVRPQAPPTVRLVSHNLDLSIHDEIFMCP